MKEKKERALNIFATDTPFQSVDDHIDTLYRELREEGVGADTQPTERVILKDCADLVFCPLTPQGGY